MVSWSAAAKSLWGKTDPDTGAWLPLVRHLEDSAAVGAHLYDTWLSEHHRRQLQGVLGKAARPTVAYLCGVHDVGKCSPAFIGQIRQRPEFAWLASRASEAGFGFGMVTDSRQAPHGAISELALTRFLTGHGVSAQTASTLACVVGGHHGAPPTEATLEGIGLRPDLGSGQWDEVRRELLAGMAHLTGFDPRTCAAMEPLPIWAQTVLSGLVILADWLASNVDLFPYDTAGDSTVDRLAVMTDRLSFPSEWQPSGDLTDPGRLLQQRFPNLRGALRPLQRAAVETSLALTEPALLIMEAPMGSGKTEAALLAAELLAARFGSGGVFFGLPTMATADPMFPRVRDWLTRVPAKGRTALNLAHSRSALNDEFQSFVRSARTVGVEEAQPAQAGVFAASWFSGRKRSGLASHVVATIDQALFADLKAKHVTLRQLALTSKVVIIDEVHAADDFMSVYLEGLLVWLGHHHVPVVLLTATLPPEQRAALAGAYASGRRGGRRASIDLADTGRYPRLTVVAREAAEHPVDPTAVRSVEVGMRRHPDDPATVLTTVQAALAGGGCVGIVCNTVKRAQELHGLLSAASLGEVVLLHSKFIAPHRAAIEQDVVRRLGPHGDRPDRIVVVGTQVLEQSLDIDFDVMITDVAPMDLLLQRLGRLHRHERGSGESQRPELLRVPVCHVTGVVEWADVPPRLASRGRRVYGAWRLLSTLAALPGESIRLPEDIPRLVTEAYDSARTPPSEWGEVWSQTLAAHQRDRERQRHNAAAFALARPREIATLHGLVEVGGAQGDDAEDSKVRGRARVRDTDESLEVVVLGRDAAGNPCLLDGVGPLSGHVLPRPLGESDGHLARAAAACTVSLPAELTGSYERLESTIRALERGPLDVSAWQTSPWLQGQLFLVLDESGQVSVGDTTLAYDRQLGLRVVGAVA